LDTRLFELQGAMAPNNQAFQDELNQHGSKAHHKNELDTMEIKCFSDKNSNDGNLSMDKFGAFLATLDKDDVYRLKGFVRLSGLNNDETSGTSIITSICVVNHAFGKWTITPVPEKQDLEPDQEDERSDSPAHDHEHHHD